MSAYVHGVGRTAHKEPPENVEKQAKTWEAWGSWKSANSNINRGYVNDTSPRRIPVFPRGLAAWEPRTEGDPDLLVYRRRGQSWQRRIRIAGEGMYTTKLLPGFSPVLDASDG